MNKWKKPNYNSIKYIHSSIEYLHKLLIKIFIHFIIMNLSIFTWGKKE